MWMNSRTTQPGKPDSPYRSGRDDGVAAGDVGRQSEIMVLEWFCSLFSLDQAFDPPTGIPPGLHGGFRDAGQLAQAHHVPDDRDLRVTLDR